MTLVEALKSGSAGGVPLLSARDCQAVRTNTVRNQYGDIERGVTASRRVTCRCCGKFMQKGSTAIRFQWDFHGSGSWTAVQCYMHEDCSATTD